MRFSPSGLRHSSTRWAIRFAITMTVQWRPAGDLPDVRSVRPRHHESVAFGGLSPIEERHGQIILGDHVGGRFTGDDPAEDAVG